MARGVILGEGQAPEGPDRDGGAIEAAWSIQLECSLLEGGQLRTQFHFFPTDSVPVEVMRLACATLLNLVATKDPNGMEHTLDSVRQMAMDQGKNRVR